MKTMLRAENVKKYYGKKQNRVAALDGVSLAVESGSFTAVIGRSGSGKTTLLKVLSGLEKPDEGIVLLEGQSIHRLDEERLTRIRRRKVGFVFQDFNLLPEFTVEENIKMPLFFDGLEPDEKYMKSIMATLGLASHAAKLPRELSGGEKQRTAIARALVTRPAIIFADEPTGNLDALSGREVLDLFLQARRTYGHTLLLATHNLELAQNAHRVLTLENGRIIRDWRSFE